MGWLQAKGYKELQRDMEAAVLSINPAVAGATAVIPKAGGLGVLIYTNALHNGAGATAAHTSGAPTVANTAGTARAFTETLLKTAAQNTFNACGEVPQMIVMSASHKQTFSGFTGIAANRLDVKDGKQGRIIGGADIYMSDFGKMEIVPHYIMSGATEVYGLNTEYGDTVYLRSYQTEELGKSGDSDRAQVLVDATFRLRSEMCCFAIKNLTA